jgi:aminopeptidase YwaD
MFDDAAIRCPMSAFGYAYLPDHLGEERTAALRLLRHIGLRGSGDEYAYEVLNLVDGRRTARQTRDEVSAIYGPVPLEIRGRVPARTGGSRWCLRRREL